MPEAYIVDAVRTPVGKRGGSLAAVHSADLGAHTLGRADAAAPASTRPRSTTSSSAAATPSARRPATSRARPGWSPACPTTCPGVTIDRQCGSSQQAVHFAAQGVHVRHPGPRRRRRSAEHERRSRSRPRCWSASSTASPRRSPSRPAGWQRYGDQEVSQFRSAEMIAEKWDLSREEMEEFALRLPRAGPHGDRRGPLRRRDRAGRRFPTAELRRPTSARATPRWRRWPASSRWRPAAGSPPPSPPRSATRPRRCWSPPSARWPTTG